MRSIEACFSFATRAALALGSILGLGLGASDEAEARYDVKPGEVAGKRGSIIRVWPLEGGVRAVAMPSASSTARPG